MADETTDVGRTEQLSIVLRYVSVKNPKSPEVYERFIALVDMERTTGEAIAEAILSKIRSLGLDMAKCVGQCFAGAASMTGRVSGVKTRILGLYPLCTFTYCESHAMNLCLNDSARTIGGALTAINSVAEFFLASPLRLRRLEAVLVELQLDKERRGHCLSFCSTRFVHRFRAVERLDSNFLVVIKALEKYTMGDVVDTARSTESADLISTSLMEFSVIFTMKMLVCLGKDLQEIATKLQARNLDLVIADRMMQDEIRSLQRTLEDREVFNEVWSEAKELADEVQTEINVPRAYRRTVNTSVKLMENLKSRFAEPQSSQ